MALMDEPAQNENHGQRRLRRAGLTGVVTLLARGVTVGIGLVTLPLTSHYLGKERFGLWLTLSSFITWMAIADFGLANSLINALSAADGKDDRRAAQQAVASAFWLVLAVAVAVILICLALAPLVSWERVFNVSSPAAVAEAAPAMLVVLVICALRLPASLVGCVYQAYQEGYLHQLWSGLSGVLGAAGLLLAIKLEAGLPWLVLAFLGSMLLADLLSAAYLFAAAPAALQQCGSALVVATRRPILGGTDVRRVDAASRVVSGCAYVRRGQCGRVRHDLASLHADWRSANRLCRAVVGRIRRSRRTAGFRLADGYLSAIAARQFVVGRADGVVAADRIAVGV